MNVLYLCVGRVWHINSVLDVSLQVSSSGCYIYIDSKPVAIIRELINDQSVLVKDVDLP